ncbi:MAG TPA: maleylacetoacetate isomerase [Caulobacteraceae bacterium]|jgi:maleylpyruvate isomerase|nr:maleylacetoacetate isomerase [Caulobacteraceae bacterium]
MTTILHGYWRSTASYRVRIALNLKGVAHDQHTLDLRQGAQRSDGYLTLNPQGLVPSLEIGGTVLTQSLAILEWLDEVHPTPPLLPSSPAARAVVRAMAGTIASDIHPLNNLRVLNALRGDFAAADAQVQAWIARWIAEGFGALEQQVEQHGGAFAFGDFPTLADCCLVPQIYSAERFAVDLTPFPRLVAVGTRALALPAFAAAHPDRQPDADPPN